MDREITIDDVARRADVSRATVSRVINGSPLVKKRTADQIHKIMQDLGYAPSARRPGPKPKNSHPSRLRAGKICLVSMGGAGALFNEPTMATVIDHIQSSCQKRKLSLLLEQMTGADNIPYPIQTQQVDGAIVMVGSGRPPYLRQAILNLSKEIPCVHLFSPGHPIISVDHATVNDVAIGAMAFQTLKAKGCRSLIVVKGRYAQLHEALVVRGRAFLDRAQHEGFVSHIFTLPMDRGDPQRIWPQPLTVADDFQSLARSIVALDDSLPKPVGVFLVSDLFAREAHTAMKNAGLFENSDYKVIIAGTTPAHVNQLSPQPILIDLCFPQLVEIAIERLVHHALNFPVERLSLMLPPRLVE